MDSLSALFNHPRADKATGKIMVAKLTLSEWGELSQEKRSTLKSTCFIQISEATLLEYDANLNGAAFYLNPMFADEV